VGYGARHILKIGSTVLGFAGNADLLFLVTHLFILARI
jgi:hypothetical protein